MKNVRPKHTKKKIAGIRWQPSARAERAIRRAGIMAGSAMSLAIVVGGHAQATTFPVTSSADGGVGTLREAVALANAAPGADDIVFDPALNGQTINLTSGQIEISDDVSIQGPGPSLLTIDGGGLDRIFNIDGQNGEVVALAGLTLTGGQASDGGAIQAAFPYASGSLSLTDMVVTDNVAADGQPGINFGGGISQVGGALTVRDSVVSGNVAGVLGDNVGYSRGSGGGIAAEITEVTILDSTVSGNTAINVNDPVLDRIGGGGIQIRDSYSGRASLTMRRSTVSGNVVGNTGQNNGNTYAIGGGINAVGLFGLTAVVVEESTISGNVAGTTTDGASVFFPKGGGMMLFGVSSFTMVNSTVSGNTVGNPAVEFYDGGTGGGIAIGAFSATVENSTIVDNWANNETQSGGGGILNFGGTSIELLNTIVANNQSPNGPDLLGNFDVGHSLVENQNDATINIDPPGTLLSGPAGLEPLADNGGPTQTHALMESSNALDTGGLAECPATDQRGIVRPQGPGCDMGAFELEPTEVTVEAVISSFDDAVADGTLVGVGSGGSAQAKLDSFRATLVKAEDFLDRGRVTPARAQLNNALKRTDGLPSPKDSVEGPAAAGLAEDIETLLADL